MAATRPRKVPVMVTLRRRVFVARSALGAEVLTTKLVPPVCVILYSIMTDDSTAKNELVGLALAGDEAALADLFEQYRSRLNRMVELRMDHRLKGRVNTSDVLQEAYIDLADQLGNYAKNPKLPFFLWLRRITGQRLAMLHRAHLGAQKRNAAIEVSIYRGGMPEASSFFLASKLIGQFTSAGNRAIRAEMQQKLLELLDEMDENDREIIALRHFEQLSNSEIAALLEISQQSASNRYFRALCRIRDAMMKMPGFVD